MFWVKQRRSSIRKVNRGLESRLEGSLLALKIFRVNVEWLQFKSQLLLPYKKVKAKCFICRKIKKCWRSNAEQSAHSVWPESENLAKNHTTQKDKKAEGWIISGNYPLRWKLDWYRWNELSWQTDGWENRRITEWILRLSPWNSDLWCIHGIRFCWLKGALIKLITYHLIAANMREREGGKGIAGHTCVLGIFAKGLHYVHHDMAVGPCDGPLCERS